MTNIRFIGNGRDLRDAAIPKSISSVFDNLFNEVLTETEKGMDFHPRANVYENEGSYMLQLELPGMDKSNIELSLEESKLVVKGERVQEMGEGVKLHLRESRYGKFSRTFYLPKDADKENIQAEFNNGLLNVSIPRREDLKAVKKIEIK